MKGWFSRSRRTAEVPHVPAMCHLAPGNQWYEPVLAAPGTLAAAVCGGAAIETALAVLERLSPDAYGVYVRDYYRAGLDRFGQSWQYADINTVLIGLARMLEPRTYLEIGVRRGRSMAMVSSVVPDVHLVGFDLWTTNYAGMDNPGPDFVESELRRLGHRGAIELISGNSASTVPAFFKRHPTLYPEIITVDGDHSEAGATRDLVNVIEHVPIGGVLVFDDVTHRDHQALRKVWSSVVVRDPRFATWEFTELGFGVAFALRQRS